MCGFAGFLGNSSLEESEFHLRNMLAKLAHRGPDDSGMWFEEDRGIALGHTRLSIVDLSSAGHQPMQSSSGRYVLVFNGEIYNHLELRSQLKGEVFWRGHSDTETLLESFSQIGIEETIKSAVGMFAFAAWDRLEQCLYLARDRIGEKPLYYGWQSGCFLFGSELKSLRAHAAFSPKTDWAVASSFLHRNYIPGSSTIYQGVNKLPQGSYICLSQKDFRNKKLTEPTAYWSLDAAVVRGIEDPFAGSYNDAVDELEFLVRRSVQQQSIADVPVGAFLSGGIDSSTVVALMQKTTTSKVKTFSIGVPDVGLDESAYGLEVAKYLGTQHIEYQLRPQDVLETISRLPEIWDEPFADSSQIPTFVVCQLASKEVKVALTGDGGDEFFLGYNQYQLYQKLWMYRVLGALPWKSMITVCSPLEQYGRLQSIFKSVRSVAGAWQQNSHQELSDYWMDRYRAGHAPLKHRQGISIPKSRSLREAAETAALMDAAMYLPEDILVKVDRASMANSLETRAPLLDHRIVEFSYRLPFEYKLKGSIGKRVLRDVLYRHVPRDLVDRPKAGFSIPLAKWLRVELKSWVTERLNSIPDDSGIYDKRSILMLWDDHLYGRRDNSDRIWAILALESFLGKSI